MNTLVRLETMTGDVYLTVISSDVNAKRMTLSLPPFFSAFRHLATGCGSLMSSVVNWVIRITEVKDHA
jgi:hypothetical protein